MKSLNLVSSQSQKQSYVDSVRQSCEKITPESIDPETSASGRERIARTLALLTRYINPCSARIADIGCGTGSLVRALAQLGSQVTAVDASSNFLKICTHPQVICKQGYVPYLKFDDAAFDGLVFTDVIATIEDPLYRLTLSELARLLTQDGWLLISTPLDYHTLDADRMFLQLVETEFEIVDLVYSYQRLSWLPFKNSRRFLLATERCAEILWGSAALTHMIVLARKKKMEYNS